MAPELTVLPGCCKKKNLFGHWIRLLSGIKLSIRVWALHFHLHWVPQPLVMAMGSMWCLLWLPLLTAWKDFQCCNCWAKPKETRLELASEDGLQGQKHTGHCHACQEHHVTAAATFCCLVKGLSCPGPGVGLDDHDGSLPTQCILWFYDWKEALVLKLCCSSLGVVLRKQPKWHIFHNTSLPFCRSNEWGLLSLFGVKWHSGRGGLKYTHYFFTTVFK